MNLPFNLKSSDRAERVSEPAGRAICQHHRILLAAKSREALSPIPCPATRNQATLRPFPKTHSCMGLSPPIHYAFWLVNQDLTSLNLQVANSTREKFAVDLAPDLRAGDLSSAFFLETGINLRLRGARAKRQLERPATFTRTPGAWRRSVGSQARQGQVD